MRQEISDDFALLRYLEQDKIPNVPTQTRYCENAISYYYKKPKMHSKLTTYTIGGECDSGSGDGGGSDWNGGGSNWGDDGSNWNSGNFFILVLTGSGIIFISRIMGDYGSKLIAAGLDKFLLQSEKQLKSEKYSLKAALPALVPVVLYGSALAVLSYVLHPERLREIVALLADVIVILAHELCSASVNTARNARISPKNRGSNRIYWWLRSSTAGASSNSSSSLCSHICDLVYVGVFSF